MSFNVTEMDKLQAIEAEVGGGFENLPRGLYHFGFRGEDSEVATSKGGYPYLRLVSEILEGELEGRSHSEFIRWFADDDPEAKKSWEERTETARLFAMRYLAGEQGIMRSIADSPNVDQERGEALQEAIVMLQASDSADEVTEAYQALVHLLDGVDFFAKISASKSGFERQNLVEYDEVKYGGVEAVIV